MTETRRLLREYVEGGSESAFRELVERYIDLVYSTALRLVAGDSHRAEDVAQMVFVRLTHNAKTLDTEVSLGGWLHRATCHVATTLMRGERRRQIRERQAVEMNALNEEADSNLVNVLPMLDEVINELGNEDREAIMLRFFEQHSFRAVGEIVGSSEDAARMRVNRALEKLQGLLRARGVAVVSVGALTTVLGTKVVSAAPVGLAATVVKGLGAGTTEVAGASSQAVVRPLAKSLKLALVPVAALVAILSAGIYAGHRAADKAAKNPALNSAAAPAALAVVPSSPTTEQQTLAETTNTPPDAILFHATDSASGAPLSAAKVRVVYYSATNSDVVNMETDSKGAARIDFPHAPFIAANILVTAAGHVPIATVLKDGEDMPTNYIMKMPAGMMVSGMVVDEDQQPVSNVKIEFTILGIDMTKRENVEFGPDTTLYTDANGRWWSDMIPPDHDNLAVVLTHEDFAPTFTNALLTSPDAAFAVLVLRKGVTIGGTLVDSGGQPVAGASIRELQNTIVQALSTKSDASGKFVLGRLNPGDLKLSIQAEGFSPVVLDTTVSNNPVDLQMKLEPGHILRGRVVDETGNPITNAVVKTRANNQGILQIEWSAKTDSEGRFEWNSAPAESGDYWIEADGFFASGEQSLRADATEHQIKLIHQTAAANSSVRIRGTVVDADSGQPLDDFKVLVGGPVAPTPPYHVQFEFATDGKDGQFDFRKDTRFMVGAYTVEIQKDGYAPMVSTNILVGGGDPILQFSLHKDAGLNGQVLLPSGDPATGATVFLYQRQGGVYMDQPGKFRKDTIVTTSLRAQPDKHGHFSFASVLDARGFIAIDDQGYADIPINAFAGQIILQPWGRVEGTLFVSGRPAAGQKIGLSQMLYRYPSNERSFPALQLWLEATTDSDGNFVFEKVPPGERLISQHLPQPFNGPGRLYDGTEKAITVSPGTVTRVELGGSGRMVKGRATCAEAKSPIKWREVAAQLSLQLPGAPVQPKLEDYPSTDAFSSALKSYNEAYRAFWTSERGHAIERAERNYSAYCSEDGSFSIPDVPPGQYELMIDIRDRAAADSMDMEGKKVGLLVREITVPESEDGKEHEALDIGTLEVPAVKGSGV